MIWIYHISENIKDNSGCENAVRHQKFFNILPNLIVRLSESYYYYYYYCSVTLRGPPPISGTKRAIGDPLVSKRPDFQGLFSYLRGSHGFSGQRP